MPNSPAHRAPATELQPNDMPSRKPKQIAEEFELI
jgi:hypothetical protein